MSKPDAPKTIDPHGWEKAAAEVERLHALDFNTELDRIDGAERQVRRLKELYLRKRKWRMCFDVPLGTDIWTKTLRDGRALVAPMDAAMALQHDLEARHAE